MKKVSVIACAFFLAQSLVIAQTDATSQYTPQTQSERFHHYIKSTFSVESIIRSAAGAAILQANNTPSQWGQGGEGYARRFGNSYAQHIMRQTLMYGAADALHEDNRYIPSGRSGFGPRLKYAVESSFLARKDDGTRRLSYSRLGSYAAVAFISRDWQPPGNNSAETAGVSFATVLGSEVGFNIAREFWPKIFKPR